MHRNRVREGRGCVEDGDRTDRFGLYGGWSNDVVQKYDYYELRAREDILRRVWFD